MGYSFEAPHFFSILFVSGFIYLYDGLRIDIPRGCGRRYACGSKFNYVNSW